MDHLIIVKHENDLIKHLMEPREWKTRNLGQKTLGQHFTGGKELMFNLSSIVCTPLEKHCHTAAHILSDSGIRCFLIKSSNNLISEMAKT